MSSVRTQGCCNQCTAVLTGPYCQNCGQPSLAVRRSFRDPIYGQTGRLLHTLGLVIAAGGYGGFTASSVLHEDPTGYAARIKAERLAERGITEAVYDERVENRFKTEYSILITLSSFSYAFAFWVVERRRGKSWLVHLAAGIQYLCFTFILTAVAFGLARLTGVRLTRHPAIGIGMVVVLAVYIMFTLQRVYGDRRLRAGAKMLFVLLVGVVSDTLLQYASLLIAGLTA